MYDTEFGVFEVAAIFMLILIIGVPVYTVVQYTCGDVVTGVIVTEKSKCVEDGHIIYNIVTNHGVYRSYSDMGDTIPLNTPIDIKLMPDFPWSDDRFIVRVENAPCELVE